VTIDADSLITHLSKVGQRKRVLIPYPCHIHPSVHFDDASVVSTARTELLKERKKERKKEKE
jgi:5'-3' exonuclease